MESATTRTQPPETYSAVGWSQSELVFSRVSEINILVGISDFNKYNYVNYSKFNLVKVNFS